MQTKNIKNFILSLTFMIIFVVFTLAVIFIDVQAIGPQDTLVGLAKLNGWFYSVIGVNLPLYIITDWASIVTLAIMILFATIGFCQLIKRKSIFKVDSNILALGIFYVMVLSCYLFFEFNVVNYRPVLINGVLEASYPSSTTMLILCVMPTAIIQANTLIKNYSIKVSVNIICIVFTALMIFGRILSGVHWITDIIGGALLSISLVFSYCFINDIINNRRSNV